MEKDGAVIYVHKGICFVEVRSPGGLGSLGKRLIKRTPSDPVAFETWIQKKRAFFDAEEERMGELDRKYEAEGRDEGERSYEPYVERPCQIPNYYGDYGRYQYEYTVDLDKLMFVIGPGAFFSLRNIPRDERGDLCRRFLDYDSSGFITRPDTPREYIKKPQDGIPPPIDVDEGLALYEELKPNIESLRWSAWMARLRSPSDALSLAITKALMSFQNHSFRSVQWNAPDSEDFEAKAEVILRAASPSCFSLNQCHRSIDNDGRRRTSRRRSHSPDRKPTVGFYEYRGCIIFLTQRCSSDEHLRAHVGLAVKHARETENDDCIVIIFSITHVAVAEISDALSDQPEVSHSKLYTLLDSLGSDEFEEGFGLLHRYLRPPCVDGGAIVRGSSKTRSPVVLPWDVLQQIMRSVDDETYYELRLVCKAIRRYWFLHPRIDKFTINSVQDSSSETFKHHPRMVLHATDKDGYSTVLYLFQYVPCAHQHNKSQCDCMESGKCCPCENLCWYKGCGMDVELYLPPDRFAERAGEIYDNPLEFWGAVRVRQLREKQILWDEVSRRARLEDGRAFRTNLILTDRRDSCEYCSRNNMASSCTEPSGEAVCLTEKGRGQ